MGQFFKVVGIIAAVLFVGASVVVGGWYLLNRNRLIVSSYSMAPGLQAGDTVGIDRDAFQTRDPERGELIAFYYPHDRKVIYIGRVIGLGGDVLSVNAGVAVINTKEAETASTGEILSIPADLGGEGDLKVLSEKNGNRVYKIAVRTTSTEPSDEYRVAPNHFFVMGDNRFNSTDSRIYGAIPKDVIFAKVTERIKTEDSRGPAKFD